MEDVRVTVYGEPAKSADLLVLSTEMVFPEMVTKAGVLLGSSW